MATSKISQLTDNLSAEVTAAKKPPTPEQLKKAAGKAAAALDKAQKALGDFGELRHAASVAADANSRKGEGEWEGKWEDLRKLRVGKIGSSIFDAGNMLSDYARTGKVK